MFYQRRGNTVITIGFQILLVNSVQMLFINHLTGIPATFVGVQVIVRHTFEQVCSITINVSSFYGHVCF